MRTKERTKSLGAHPSADRSHLGDFRPAVSHAIDAEVEDLKTNWNTCEKLRTCETIMFYKKNNKSDIPPTNVENNILEQ